MKLFSFVLVSVFVFFNSPDNYIELYGKKIHKEIRKIYEEEVILEKVNLTEVSDLGENNAFYNVQSDFKNIGFVFINKVNACMTGGCNRPGLMKTERYDHFYYMVIFDVNFSVLKITILDYQSEYGYEICSKNWLKQFKGSVNKAYEYDKNIDAISGATVSGQAMVDEINVLNKIIQNRIINNKF